ncbi:MAG: Bug family tripartite tricarboxylate transporter substrate binding protein [Burkholderiaceae bacterium]
MTLRRRFLSAASLSAIAVAANVRPSFAQANYPSRPIRWVVPFPPGSPVDAVARRLGEAVSKELGVPVVVDNKPGAVGSIGANEVARAAPDGYTFMATIGDPLVAVLALLKNVPYDPRKDFTFVSKVSANGPVLVAHPSFKPDNLAALLADGKARGTVYSYGSWGPGSLPVQVMESMAQQAGVKFREIPYRGSPPAMQDVMGGQIDMTITAPHVAASLAAAGKLKVLAAMGEQRSPLLPNVQTFAEAGFSSFVFTNGIWVGLVGPAGMDAAIRDRNARAVRNVVQTPEMRKFFEENGFRVVGSSPADFERQFRAEVAVVPPLIHALGVVPQ